MNATLKTTVYFIAFIALLFCGVTSLNGQEASNPKSYNTLTGLYVGFDGGVGAGNGAFYNYLSEQMNLQLPRSSYGLQAYFKIGDEILEFQIGLALRFAGEAGGSINANFIRIRETLRAVYNFARVGNTDFGVFVGLGVANNCFNYTNYGNMPANPTLPELMTNPSSFAMTQPINFTTEVGLQCQLNSIRRLPMLFFVKWEQDVNSSKWRASPATRYVGFSSRYMSDMPKFLGSTFSFGVMLGISQRKWNM